MSRRSFGSLRRYPSGRWQASYWQEGARHLAPSTFATKADAARWLSTTHADLSRGDWFDPRRAQVLFGDWADTWKKNVVDLRPSTFARDEGYLNRYILPVFGEMPLGDISVGLIRTWVSELNASGLAPATVVKAGQILSKVLRSAVEEGIISTNPTSSVRLPRLERHEMRNLSPVEVSRLADAIHPRYRAVVFLGAYGGLRAGELFGLRVSRLDLAAQRVEVVEQVVEVSGHLHFGAPKTKAGRRTVPVPAVVCDALTEHLRLWPSDDLVFTAPDGGPVRLASWRSRFFKRAVEAADVAPLRVHDLRHTAVSLWIAAGASPREIASRAGHTSVSVVLDRYGHLLPGSENRVNDELDRLAATHSVTVRHDTVDGFNDGDEGQLTGANRPAPLRLVRAIIARSGDDEDGRGVADRLSPGTFEWAQRDSNPRPQPCEGCALTS
jgi:integrase